MNVPDTASKNMVLSEPSSVSPPVISMVWSDNFKTQWFEMGAGRFGPFNVVLSESTYSEEELFPIGVIPPEKNECITSD